MRWLGLIVSLLIFVSCCKSPTETEPEGGNPYNLQIELIAENVVELTWDGANSANNSYLISKKTGEASWVENFSELEAGNNSLIDSIYTQAFIVFSYYLSEIVDNTVIGTSDTVAWFSDFSIPTEVTLEHIKQDSIKISWHDNSFGEFIYGIDKKAGDGNWEENYILYEPEPANGHNSDMSYVDYNDSLNDSIHYRIYLMNGISKSVEISSSIYSSLLPPSGLKATVEGGSIKLTWLDNYQTDTGFIIERKVHGGEFEEIQTTGANSQSFLDDDLDPTEIYFYRIKVMVNDLQSDYSDTVVGCVEHEGFWVPLDYPTIQSAVDASNFWSQIIILPGTYYENVVIQDKYPEFSSLYSIFGNEEYIEQTVINGGMNGSVFAFVNCDGDTPKISGVTIQNGSGTYSHNEGSGLYYFFGGGIFLENSDIEISNLKISDNLAEYGGGIACIQNSNCTINNCNITNNETNHYYGGGIYCKNSILVIENSSIDYNFAESGGGISVDESCLIMSNSSASFNNADMYCGGMDIYNSDTTLDNILIDGNSALTSGGIGCSGNLNITNAIICNNEAQTGGGIGFNGSKLENVILYNNTAEFGGAIYTNYSDIIISNDFYVYFHEL